MDRVYVLLDAARDICGTDAALARRIGVDPSHPAQWRSGKRRINAACVGLLADVVGLDKEDATRLALQAVVDSCKDPEQQSVLRRVFGFFRVLGGLRRRPHVEHNRRIGDNPDADRSNAC